MTNNDRGEIIEVEIVDAMKQQACPMHVDSVLYVHLEY